MNFRRLLNVYIFSPQYATILIDWRRSDGRNEIWNNLPGDAHVCNFLGRNSKLTYKTIWFCCIACSIYFCDSKISNLECYEINYTIHMNLLRLETSLTKLQNWTYTCFIYIVMSNIYCVVFFSFHILCTQCCRLLWIVHSWLPLRFSLTFIYNECVTK